MGMSFTELIVYAKTQGNHTFVITEGSGSERMMKLSGASRTYSHTAEPRNVRKAEKFDMTTTQHLETVVELAVPYQQDLEFDLPAEFDRSSMPQWTVTANGQPMIYEDSAFALPDGSLRFEWWDLRNTYYAYQTSQDPVLDVTLNISYDKEIVNSDVQRALNLAEKDVFYIDVTIDGMNLSTTVTSNQLTKAYNAGKRIGMHVLGTDLYIEDISITKAFGWGNEGYIITPTGASFYYPDLYPFGLLFLHFSFTSDLDNPFNIGMLLIPAANP